MVTLYLVFPCLALLSCVMVYKKPIIWLKADLIHCFIYLKTHLTPSVGPHGWRLLCKQMSIVKQSCNNVKYVFRG